MCWMEPQQQLLPLLSLLSQSSVLSSALKCKTFPLATTWTGCCSTGKPGSVHSRTHACPPIYSSKHVCICVCRAASSYLRCCLFYITFFLFFCFHYCFHRYSIISVNVCNVIAAAGSRKINSAHTYAHSCDPIVCERSSLAFTTVSYLLSMVRINLLFQYLHSCPLWDATSCAFAIAEAHIRAQVFTLPHLSE